jgi:hypothetical protein
VSDIGDFAGVTPNRLSLARPNCRVSQLAEPAGYEYITYITGQSFGRRWLRDRSRSRLYGRGESVMSAQDQNLLKAEYFERKAKQVHGAEKRTRLLATARKYRDLAKTSPVEGDDEVRAAPFVRSWPRKG